MADMIKILYTGNGFICCVKEPGIVSEEPGMPSHIRNELDAEEVYCVHRLDKDTGGAMVYALDGHSAAVLSSEFAADGSAEKRYLAVIPGTMEEQAGTLNDLLFHDSRKNKSFIVSRHRKGVREASLSYETLCERAGASLIMVTLHSGRTHQIRVQFSGRKHPLLGDRRYGSSVDCPLALWSYKLSFRDPAGGDLISVCAEPPDQYPWNIFDDILHSGIHDPG